MLHPSLIGIRGSALIGLAAGLLPWLRRSHGPTASMPTDTRWAVAMMKCIRWMKNISFESCHGWKRGLGVRSSSLVPVARTPAFAGWDSLIARSDRPRLRYGDDLEWFLAVQSKIINQKSSMAPRSPADGDQTSILAVPALQSAASVTAVFTSYFY